MKPNILDLREERCPMALLLAKRHTKSLALNQSMHIWVKERQSMNDIEHYLREHGFTVERELMTECFCLQVNKGILLNV